MTRFYIVRHGFSEANAKGVIAGQVEAPLTEMGREQARRAGEALRDVKIDVAYSSDLSRAYDTAVLALEGRMPVVKRKGLREIDCGEWELVEFPELDKRFPEQRKLWHEHFGRSHPEGGEALSDAYARINGEILSLARLHEGKNVFIASHGGVLCCVLSRAHGVSCFDMTKEYIPANASITVLDVEGDRFTLIKESDVSHLGEISTTLPRNV